MARNKYPEETVSKIIEVSAKLFLEKGFENTSMQDIVDELGGLSKGAIYHHFKSKDEILVAVMDKIYSGYDDEWLALRQKDDGRTGLQKMKMLFEASLFHQSQNDMFSMAPNFLKNPKMLAMQLQGIYEESAPNLLQPIIEQGMADKSIKTKYPREMAEVLLLLTNIWLAPVAHTNGSEGLAGRMGYFLELLEHLELPIFDEATVKRMEEIAALYDSKEPFVKED